MRNLLLIAATLILCGTPSAAGWPTGNGANVIIIEGTVLEISPVFGKGLPSGVVPHYRLVKYRVNRVCKGKYTESELIIDHVLMTGEELKDRKVGDRVYALAWKTKKKSGTGHTYPGIRDTLAGLKYLYHGRDVLPATPPGCSFDERELMTLQ